MHGFQGYVPFSYMNIGTFNTKKQGEMVHFAVFSLTRDIDTHRVGNKREKGGKGKRGGECISQ